MHLEEQYPEAAWISERSIQAERQHLHTRGEHLPHLPDGILVLPNRDGTQEQIDIEVQVSVPPPHKVKKAMGDFWISGSNRPLWYYVTKEARDVVTSIYDEMVRGGEPRRSSISIMDLWE
jgi:hypothetical protein